MNSLLLILAMLALAVTQVLTGGRQIALCLPGLALLALAAVLSWWPKRREKIPGGTVESVGAAGFFFGYVVIRALLSPEPYLARSDLFTATGAMTLYLLVALNITSSKTRLWFVVALLVLGAANCVIGTVQFLKGQNFMVFDFLPRTDYGSRASGFFSYPNHLSGFLEITALMGLATAFWSRWPSWAKMLAGYTSLVCLVGIVATGSRGGYISIAIGLMVFGLLTLVLIGKLASNRAVGLVLAGMLFIGGAGWGVHRLTSKSFLLQTRADETLTVDVGRLRMWQAAWQQSRLHPIVGTGSGTYLYYGRQFRAPTIQADPVHAHDDYFEFLAEYGVLGIIAMVIFLETHLRHGWNAFLDRMTGREDSAGPSSNSLALTLGALCATITCLVHCFLDFNLHMPANVLVMALVFGLLASRDETAEEDAASERDSGLPAFLRLALPGLGVWIALGILPTAPSEYYASKARGIILAGDFLTSEDAAHELENVTRRGLESDPQNPILHFYLGDAQIALADLAPDPASRQNLYTQSLEAYGKAIRLAPGDVRFVLALAASLDALERYSEAESAFGHALELDPRSSGVQNAYAAHLEKQGKLAEAEARYQLALNLGGGEISALGLARMADEQKTQHGPEQK